MSAPDPQPAVAAPVSIPGASSPPEPAPTTATLEGVTLLGDVRQAMFRTPTETITLTEGAQLGERRATRIGAEGVELREPTGRLRMVSIGGGGPRRCGGGPARPPPPHAAPPPPPPAGLLP